MCFTSYAPPTSKTVACTGEWLVVPSEPPHMTQLCKGVTSSTGNDHAPAMPMLETRTHNETARLSRIATGIAAATTNCLLCKIWPDPETTKKKGGKRPDYVSNPNNGCISAHALTIGLTYFAHAESTACNPIASIYLKLTLKY